MVREDETKQVKLFVFSSSIYFRQLSALNTLVYNNKFDEIALKLARDTIRLTCGLMSSRVNVSKMTCQSLSGASN